MSRRRRREKKSERYKLNPIYSEPLALRQMIGGDERQRAAISFPAHRDSLHRRQRRHYKLSYSIAFVLLYTTIEMFPPVAFARQQNKKTEEK